LNKKQLIEEKNQRFYDAIALKEPDRVPIAFQSMFYPAVQTGMTIKEAMYKPIKFAKAALKVYSRYDWDQYPDIQLMIIGKMYDALGYKIQMWPGAKDPDQRLRDNQSFQALDKPWLKAEDYNDYLMDPTYFILRNILPRQYTKFASLAKFLNPYELLFGFDLFTFFMDKEVKKMIKDVRKALLPFINMALGMRKYKKGLEKKGCPVEQSSGWGYVPFDYVSVYLRGLKGTMLDMIRNPEELKRACEPMVDLEMENLDRGSPFFSDEGTAFIALWRGGNAFMSNAQFEEFYLPGLTDLMDKLVKRGLTPMFHFQGNFTDRLNYLEELAKKHKGKMVYYFDVMDIIEVKERMGDYVCIRGGVPGSLLVGGTPQQVDEHMKKILEGCMEGGGYIVDVSNTIPNEAKHENVKAMTDAVHKYGVYRK